MDPIAKPPDPENKSLEGQSEQLNPESHSHPAMATIQNDDELLLARIGYKQVCFTRWTAMIKRSKHLRILLF